MAITMGIDTIMRAEKIILMAWGEEKANDRSSKVVEGEDHQPGACLERCRMHPNIEVVIDENAAQIAYARGRHRGW